MAQLLLLNSRLQARLNVFVLVLKQEEKVEEQKLLLPHLAKSVYYKAVIKIEKTNKQENILSFELNILQLWQYHLLLWLVKLMLYIVQQLHLNYSNSSLMAVLKNCLFLFNESSKKQLTSRNDWFVIYWQSYNRWLWWWW